MDVHSTDRESCFISPAPCRYLFIFPRTRQRLTSASSPVKWRLTLLSLLITSSLKREREKNFTGKEKGSQRCHSLKRQLHLKSVLTKINNQTNNQTTICSNLKDELLLGALCSFVTSGATMFFLMLLVCFFSFFLSITSPSSLISMALWFQAAHQRVEKNSLAMYKKEQVKPKMLFLMSFLYCSLVSFFVTVIIWWRFPNCTKLHGN